MGYIILPFSIVLYKDPLEYVRHAKATIDRKKHSLEAICSYACAKLVLNLLGVKVIGYCHEFVLDKLGLLALVVHLILKLPKKCRWESNYFIYGLLFYSFNKKVTL